jgi:hypothetical protein
MKRTRDEVHAIASIANQEQYWTECDGIAAFRCSFIGVLVKNNNAGKGVHQPTHDGVTRATRRSSAEAPISDAQRFEGAQHGELTHNHRPGGI